jgi:hypothetical protein
MIEPASTSPGASGSPARTATCVRFICRAHAIWCPVLLLLQACGASGLSPSIEDVVGDYEATSFVGDGNDVLAKGGELSMSLRPDGTVSGVMLITSQTPGGPFVADLAGTYTLVGVTSHEDDPGVLTSMTSPPTGPG